MLARLFARVLLEAGRLCIGAASRLVETAPTPLVGERVVRGVVAEIDPVTDETRALVIELPRRPVVVPKSVPLAGSVAERYARAKERMN